MTRAGARADGPDLGDRDLEVREHLEQEGLELVVGAVDLVDQEHDGLLALDRLEQRPPDQELAAEELLLGHGALLRRPDVEQLARVVPLVDGVGDVEALVALQTDQPRAERSGERLRRLGLADPRLALEQQRLLEAQGEEQRRRQPPLGQVGGPAAGLLQLADRPVGHASTIGPRTVVRTGASAVSTMTSSAFTDVIVPRSRQEAVGAFGDGAGVTVVAGGTIVMPEIALGRLRPTRTLLLARAGLDGITRENGRVTIGATVPVAGSRTPGAARHLLALRRRHRGPRAGDDRRQPLRPAGCREPARRPAGGVARARRPRALGRRGRGAHRLGGGLPRRRRRRPARAGHRGRPSPGAPRRPGWAGRTPTPTRSSRWPAPRRTAASASPSAAPARAPGAPARSSRRSPTEPRRRRRPARAGRRAAARRRARVGLVPRRMLPRSWPAPRPAVRRLLHAADRQRGRARGREPAAPALLHVLREELDVTSPKAGCQQGGCGACTVLVDGEPRRSCLLPLAAGRRRLGHHGRGARRRPALSRRSRPRSTSTTRPSAASARRASCWRRTALLERERGRRRATEIIEALAGHVCRCTGYVKIVEAVEAAARGDVGTTHLAAAGSARGTLTEGSAGMKASAHVSPLRRRRAGHRADDVRRRRPRPGHALGEGAALAAPPRRDHPPRHVEGRAHPGVRDRDHPRRRAAERLRPPRGARRAGRRAAARRGRGPLQGPADRGRRRRGRGTAREASRRSRSTTRSASRSSTSARPSTPTRRGSTPGGRSSTTSAARPPARPQGRRRRGLRRGRRDRRGRLPARAIEHCPLEPQVGARRARGGRPADDLLVHAGDVLLDGRRRAHLQVAAEQAEVRRRHGRRRLRRQGRHGHGDDLRAARAQGAAAGQVALDARGGVPRLLDARPGTWRSPTR